MKKTVQCRTQTLINVENVKASSHWYQKVLDCQSGHGGDEYEQLIQNGEMLLQLHAWDVSHDQPSHKYMGKRRLKNRGNGVVLWFQIDDFDATIKRVRKMRAKVLVPTGINPNAHHRECWLQDPDGYVVVIAGAYGDI